MVLLTFQVQGGCLLYANLLLLLLMLLLHVHGHLLVLLLLLHAIHVVHDHLLRARRNLLLVHRLLRRMLSLLQVHLLILDSGRSFRLTRLLLSQVRLARRLALRTTTDRNGRLCGRARQFRLGCTGDA